MSLTDLESNGIGINFGLFAVAAAAVWWAGTKLERLADAIAEKTGLGSAFVGTLMLAVASSLPEITTTAAATLGGNSSLAIHNLVGSVIVNTAILAIVDLAVGHSALTHRSPKYVLLMEGVGVIFVLTIVVIGMTVGPQLSRHFDSWGVNVGVFGWCAAVLAAYLLMLFVTHRAQGHPRWKPTTPDGESGASGGDDEAASDSPNAFAKTPLGRVYWYFAAAALAVLAAGWAVAELADTLAMQTGLGSTVVGMTLLAMATSLPELSTTLAAVRQANYDMAFSNIFGSNAFTISLLVWVAVLAGAESFAAATVPSVQLAVAVSMCLTCVYLWGLLERQDKTVLRMGYDSAAVLALALLGNAAIFWLQ